MRKLKDFKFRYFNTDLNIMFQGMPAVGDEYPIIQYTGIKDCEGKEIWEGDIIEFVGHNKYGKVCWHEELAGFRFYTLGGFMVIHRLIGSPMKVIGNIYENPLLFEAFKKTHLTENDFNNPKDFFEDEVRLYNEQLFMFHKGNWQEILKL